MPVNQDVIITCALTGAGDTVRKSPHVPVTPEQIARSAVEAAGAGAAVVHIHVREPETGAPSRDPRLYREVVERIKETGTDVIINLTAGMGGDLVIDPDAPLRQLPGTDLVGGLERLPHVEDLLPDICTLDCGSLNFGDGSNLYVSTPDMLRAAPAASRSWAYGPSWRSSTPDSCGSPSSSLPRDCSTLRPSSSSAWVSPGARPPTPVCSSRW